MSSLRQAFFQHVSQTSLYPEGFEVSQGKGIYLYDQEATAYIDCISGISVSALGHGHPRVLSAIREQLERHLHTQVYGEHIIQPQVLLAEKLASLLPRTLNTVFFVNSGAEAVEGALKLARKYAGRYEIVACRHAYHGSTAGADSLRSDLLHTASSRPLVPGIRLIDFNSISGLAGITENTAAVIVEPIQGEAGVIVPDADYLKELRARCHATGSLLIFDEVQTGMGRTGNMWAFESENVIPDILVLAKALGGGLPLGAFISDRKIMQVLSKDPPLGHMTTCGGNALCCAAGLAAIQVILEEELHLHSSEKGEWLRDPIIGHPQVKEVRGRGLLLAIELHEASKLQEAVKLCREEKLLVDWFLFNDRSIRMAPPLTITVSEIKDVNDRIGRALDRL